MPELSDALNRPQSLTFGGRTFDVSILDFNDLAELEDRFGSVDAIDFEKVKHQRFAAWVILRKSDPSLSIEEKRAGVYKMTEHEVGAMLTLDNPQAATDFVLEVFRRSGLMSEGNDEGEAGAEGDSKNVPTRKAKPALKS